MAYLDVAQALAAEREIAMIGLVSYPKVHKKLPKVDLDELRRRASRARPFVPRSKPLGGWDILRRIGSPKKRKGAARG